MFEWVLRGLRIGIVTSGYPKRPEQPPPGFRGRVDVLAAADEPSRALEQVCPTGAITVDGGRVTIDRGRCVLCGACVAAEPDRFRFMAEYETAAVQREALVVGGESLQPAPPSLLRPLRRSIHIRHVDTGSDGSEEWEIAALSNPYYDMQRLGFFFTAAPRHADILLVTGGVTSAMAEPLRRAWAAMPEPKAVIAGGTDACSGGFAAGAGEVVGGVDRVLPVDVYVPGSPPSPIALLHGLLLASGRIVDGAVA